MAKKVIMAVSNYWTSPFQVGSHHFARMFAKNGWKVLFISDPISPWHFLMKNKEQLIERYNIYKRFIKSGDDNISIYVPMSLMTPNEKPIFNSSFVANNWYKFTLPNIVKYAESLGFGNVDLLWFDSVVQYFWINNITYKKSLFRVSDILDAFKKSNRNIKLLEDKLKNQVDIIIYTAESLKSYLSGYETKASYIPNGVDINHFLNSGREIPGDLRKIPKPIAIYVGAVDEWFGTDFLVEVAKKCRQISFVIIGSPNIDVSKLKNEKNIFLLGKRDYSEVPKYIYNSDIGIITFDTAHPVVKSVNPIKLYEYLACGIPVVATKWGELELINSPAYLAKDIDDFVRGLNLFLNLTSGEKLSSDKLIEFAKANSWDARFDKLKNLIV
ncbi:MAG: glycosyltransferase [Actinobacteria bacterium]|nr:glycosyltransferase [Actinomycetota bacterium]